MGAMKARRQKGGQQQASLIKPWAAEMDLKESMALVEELVEKIAPAMETCGETYCEWHHEKLPQNEKNATFWTGASLDQ